MRSVDLAWTLAASVDEHLDILQRDLVYVTLGGGDTCGAIRELISIAACGRVPLPRILIDALLDWHAAHDDRDARLGVAIAAIPELTAATPAQVKAAKAVRPLTPVRSYRRAPRERAKR